MGPWEPQEHPGPKEQGWGPGLRSEADPLGQVPVRLKGFPNGIIVLHVSGIHAACNFTEEFIPGGYKQSGCCISFCLALLEKKERKRKKSLVWSPTKLLPYHHQL